MPTPTEETSQNVLVFVFCCCVPLLFLVKIGSEIHPREMMCTYVTFACYTGGYVPGIKLKAQKPSPSKMTTTHTKEKKKKNNAFLSRKNMASFEHPHTVLYCTIPYRTGGIRQGSRFLLRNKTTKNTEKPGGKTRNEKTKKQKSKTKTWDTHTARRLAVARSLLSSCY